jgi:hypothetical protein
MKKTPTANNIWAITSYFNVLNNKMRYHNFQLFRKHLQMPLVAVEFSPQGNFELQACDAEILVQISQGDTLWQKERLLNIAIQHLPNDCNAVAWLDCDIIFQDPDWVPRVIQALDVYPMVQPYTCVYDLSQKQSDVFNTRNAAHRNSVISRLQNQEVTLGIFRSCGKSDVFRYATGLAWAVRREILEKHRFYDACIVGSGDKVMVAAAYGQIGPVAQALNFSPNHIEHFRQWGKPFYQSINGNVGYVSGDIIHLWHGDLNNRGYVNRYQNFHKYRFNPYQDIALNEQNTWSWDSDKKEMHQYLVDYFKSRKEK